MLCPTAVKGKFLDVGCGGGSYLYRLKQLGWTVYGVEPTVPNTRSLNFSLFGKEWYSLDTPRHVISYGPCALKFLSMATGFKIVNLKLRSGAFNFVRSLKYHNEESAEHWHGWAKIDWVHNRAIRRMLKPFFFLVDILGRGDIIYCILMKADKQSKSQSLVRVRREERLSQR
jgi:SAM-dependent methyltransferase